MELPTGSNLFGETTIMKFLDEFHNEANLKIKELVTSALIKFMKRNNTSVLFYGGIKYTNNDGMLEHDAPIKVEPIEISVYKDTYIPVCVPVCIPVCIPIPQSYYQLNTKNEVDSGITHEVKEKEKENYVEITIDNYIDFGITYEEFLTLSKRGKFAHLSF